MSWALVGLVTGDGAAGVGAFLGAAALRGGVGFAATCRSPAGAAGAPADGVATKTSRSRRATGASTVLDADFTYSPISVSFARTILLSTPSSLASSCTRGLPATALLIPRSTGSPARPHFGT